jgi:hypothetical protein
MLYRISISIINEDVHIRTLFQTLEKHGHNIRELEFKNAHLNLTGSYGGNCPLLEMPTVLGQLTSLTPDLRHRRHTPVVLQTLGNLCSNLRHLDLEQCNTIPEEELNVLLFKLKDSLISLKLYFPDHGYINTRDEHNVECSLFIHCYMLEKLWLKGKGTNKKDIMVIGQIMTLKELKLEMPFFNGIADKDYKKAFEQQQLNCLEHLELHSHSDARDCIFETRKFGNKATLALLKNCPNLTYWSCHNIQVSGFAEAVTDCGPNTINLCKLAFYNCTLGVRDLKAVVSLCNLKELYIIDFHSLWDENDEFEQVNLTSLQTLTLERCLYLDTKIFKALMKGTTKLQNLNLSYLYQIEGYIDIFAECNLEHLETFRAVYWTS